MYFILGVEAATGDEQIGPSLPPSVVSRLLGACRDAYTDPSLLYRVLCRGCHAVGASRKLEGCLLRVVSRLPMLVLLELIVQIHCS